MLARSADALAAKVPVALKRGRAVANTFARVPQLRPFQHTARVFPNAADE
jgi:hypothetical protein